MFSCVCVCLCVYSDRSPFMVYIILAVWTWGMLQFPLHLSGSVVILFLLCICIKEIGFQMVCIKHSKQEVHREKRQEKHCK